MLATCIRCGTVALLMFFLFGFGFGFWFGFVVVVLVVVVVVVVVVVPLHDSGPWPTPRATGAPWAVRDAPGRGHSEVTLQGRWLGMGEDKNFI